MAEQQGWLWDSQAGQFGQYRDFATGRLLSDGEVTEIINDIIDETISEPVGALNTMLEDRRLSAEEWAIAFALLLQNAYIQQAELAAGGESQMSPELWALVIVALAIQHGFLEDFARQVNDGQLTGAQIEARTKMYVNSSREAFWTVKDEKAKRAGSTQERWIPIGDASTCAPCFSGEAMGWQPIGTFAQPGSGRVQLDPLTLCDGLTNCRCEKEYR
jgi:hypothetical protein